MSDRLLHERKPELLAPAGDEECMRAAVANGADAVYFGLEEFNARRRAANFTLARLPEVMGYLHDHNVRGYVAFNTLVFSGELKRAADFIAGIGEAGADAVIVQDLGLIRVIQRMAPTLPVHASTQMTQTHAAGIEMLREMGVRRVILARELSLDEIGRIARTTSVELEVFVHGAICISYSGQCLASESLWGRSANRGVCGQACRLPYQLVVDGRPVGSREPSYLLSAKDLAAWDMIPQLAAAGVRGFKIEGRLKSAHYVAATTAVYRDAIDAALSGRAFRLSRERELELAQSFSRGFSHGFLEGDRHQGLVDGRFPRSRGVDIGKVAGKTRQAVLVEVWAEAAVAGELPLKPGDGVVFDHGYPEQDEQGGRVYSVKPADGPRAAAGEQRPVYLELEFGHGDVNLAAVAVGSTVWKTDDPALRRRLETTFARDRVASRVPLHVRALISTEGRLVIEAVDDRGPPITIESDDRLEPARRHPLTAALLREQFGRTGDTPYELASVELLDGGVPVDSLPLMAPKSVLNHLRREVTRLLLERRSAGCRHEIAERNAVEVIRREICSRSAAASQQPSKTGAGLCVLVRDIAQLEAVLAWHCSAGQSSLSVVYCDFADRGDDDRAVETCRSAGVAAGLATTRICKPGEEDSVRLMVGLEPDVILVRNLPALRLLRREAPDLTVVVDYSLNAANQITAATLLDLGASRVTASYDLNMAQLAAMCARLPRAACEIVIHQHVPMFHMAHCVASLISKADNCEECGHPCRKHRIHLRDRLGVDHPVLVDSAGRATAFGGRVQSAAELLPQLRDLNVSRWRVELLDESPQDARRLVELYARWMRSSADAEELGRCLKRRYPAGLTRGTFDFP